MMAHRLAALTATALLLAGCGSQPQAASAPASQAASAATSAKPAAPASQTGASGKPASSGSAAPSGLIPFKLASPSKSINSLPDSVAQAFGMFTSRGLAPSFVLAASAPAIAGLQAGELDVAAAVGTGVRGAIKGLPLRLVYVAVDKPPYLIVGSKGLTSVEQLRGKTIAVAAQDTASYAVLAELMRRRGMQPGDYKTLTAADEAARAAALTTGAVQGAVMDPSGALKLQKQGFAVVVNMGDEVQLPSAGYVASLDEIHNKRDVLRRGLQALQEGLKTVRENKDKVLPVISKEYGVTPDEASQLYDVMKSSWTVDGHPSDGAIQFEFTNDQRDMQLAAPPKADDVFDFSLLSGN